MILIIKELWFLFFGQWNEIFDHIFWVLIKRKKGSYHKFKKMSTPNVITETTIFEHSGIRQIKRKPVRRKILALDKKTQPRTILVEGSGQCGPPIQIHHQLRSSCWSQVWQRSGRARRHFCQQWRLPRRQPGHLWLWGQGLLRLVQQSWLEWEGVWLDAEIRADAELIWHRALRGSHSWHGQGNLCLYWGVSTCG